MNITIRPEEPRDHRAVEEITRKAFWNLYRPGCDEHYLAHILRGHEDFIPDLALVLECDGNLAGNVMYTRAKLVADNGAERNILTFGPVSVSPEYQRRGLGRKLIAHSFEIAKKLGYQTVVIFGTPGNYVGLGFKSCQRLNIGLGNDIYPTAMLAKELVERDWTGEKWTYRGSPVYEFDKADAEAFDAGLEPMKKEWRPSQEEFFILSNSRMFVK